MEREKDKKRPVEYHATHEAVLPIVDRLKNELENNVRRLKSKELDVLLWWKSVPVSAIGNVANTQILCQKFAEGGVEEGSIPALWMEIDKAEHDAHHAERCSYDIAYRRFEEQKKSDVEQAHHKMSSTEKELFKQKMAEMDDVDTDNGQSLSPTPIPGWLTYSN